MEVGVVAEFHEIVSESLSLDFHRRPKLANELFLFVLTLSLVFTTVKGEGRSRYGFWKRFPLRTKLIRVD